MLKMFITCQTSLAYIERIDVFVHVFCQPYKQNISIINKNSNNIFAANDGENYIASLFALTFFPISSMGGECLGDWLNIFEWG